MEFSKKYREELCNNLKTLFGVHNNAFPQWTYFFSGAVPDHATLHAMMVDEWAQPQDGVYKAPDHTDSSLNPVYCGKTQWLLDNCSWATEYEDVSVSNALAADVEANTTSLSLPIGIVGAYTALPEPVVEGFDFFTKGETEITWALTLWVSSNATYRGWYVMHRVGTVLDPDAEIVLQSNLFTEENPTLLVNQISSPLF